MICEKNYSQKEVLVFEGFIKLADEGISISNIKVADIAKSAGIGKGTLYEYFENKEEIIAKSILYKMNKEFGKILFSILNAQGFENKCNIGLQTILELMATNCSYFQILMINKDIHNLLKCINHGKDEMIQLREYVLEMLDPIIDLGIDEGVINKDHDRLYIRSVFISVCSGMSTMVRFSFGELTIEDIKRQKDIAYTILIKSLS
ncbi:TetR/AcrR family transcriptional regulator [Romboutsia sp.]|uniref:TetR/AcrR family transcriptional regulator n=1 Tax=Romboutsia sp. TaxID=1965302 RepID=UPI003F41576B